MEEYYRGRAKGFDEEYYQGRDPPRQKELQYIADVSKEALKAREVLDMACGTAYWTQIVSETAQSIAGTDFAEEMLEIAKGKHFNCPVSFCKADAYGLPFKSASFTGGMADFWLSHIPREKIEPFLEDFHRLLESKSMVVMADNVYVPGIGGEFIKKEGDVNTYKIRKLADGSEHLVLKNYYSIDELVSIFAKHARGFDRKNIFYGKYYWYLYYELK
jgi:ubiquinone/menaquinone biosynthesis C-methylase UbiE